MYTTTLLAITALAGLTSAQSITSLFLPGTDEQSLIASVVTSDKTATTYSIACPPGADSNDCGLPTGILFTQGPATMAYTMDADLGISAGSTELLFTATIQCSLAGTISAVCTASYGGIEANDPGVETTTVSGTDYSFVKATLTNSIAAPQTGSGAVEVSATKTTASGAKATGSSTLATSGVAAKTGSASGTAVAQSTGASGSASVTAAGQSTGTSAPSSSTSQAGAQAMITARPAWIAGGAAVAWALL